MNRYCLIHRHTAVPDSWGGSAGFTLFETLAATMILATALVLLLQLFSGGLGASHLADQYTRAVLHGREKMEEILLATQMEETIIDGNWEDGFSWKAEISRSEPERKETGVDDPELFYIRLEVNWMDGSKQRQMELQSLALAKIRRDGK